MNDLLAEDTTETIGQDTDDTDDNDGVEQVVLNANGKPVIINSDRVNNEVYNQTSPLRNKTTPSGLNRTKVISPTRRSNQAAGLPSQVQTYIEVPLPNDIQTYQRSAEQISLPSRIRTAMPSLANLPGDINTYQRSALPTDIQTYQRSGLKTTLPSNNRPSLPNDIKTYKASNQASLPNDIQTYRSTNQPASLPNDIKTYKASNQPASLPTDIQTYRRSGELPSNIKTYKSQTYPDSIQADLSRRADNSVTAWEREHLDSYGKLVDNIGTLLRPSLMQGSGQPNTLNLQWNNKRAIDEANKFAIREKPEKVDTSANGMVKWRWGNREEVIIRDSSDFHLLPYPHIDIVVMSILMPLNAKIAHKISKVCHGVHYDESQRTIWVKAPDWKAAASMAAVVKALSSGAINHHAAMRMFDVINELNNQNDTITAALGQFILE